MNLRKAPKGWRRIHYPNALEYYYSNEIREWMKVNITYKWGIYHWDYYSNEIDLSFYFEDEDEALLFTLTWG